MSNEEGRRGDGAGGGESLRPLPRRWSCSPAPPPAVAPAGVGCRGRVLFGLREVMPCCSGESPARGCWGKGERSRQPPGKGGRSADSRGSIPAVPPCSSASLPWEPPRCPDECAGLGRRLLLATATARQPEPPQSPLLPRPPPEHAAVAPCAPAWQLSWCGCPVLQPSAGPPCQAALWVLLGCRPVSLTGSEKAVGVSPAPVEQDVSQTVSQWGFPSPHRAPPSVPLGGQCCGHSATAQTELQVPFLPLSASLKAALASLPGRGQPSLLLICLPVCCTLLSQPEVSVPTSCGQHIRARAGRR